MSITYYQGQFRVDDSTTPPTMLIWHGGSWVGVAPSSALSTVSAQLGSNHALTGGTFENIISVSLGAGTWVCWAHATVIHQGTSDATIQIYDGTNVKASNSMTNQSTWASALSCVTEEFVLTTTTTIYLRVANANGGSVHAAGQNSSSGNVATTLTAVRVA